MSQTVSSAKSRIAFIDIVRGILIILVVVGHTNLPYTQYIFWFHMPAFFILSGSLYKPRQLPELFAYAKKTLSSLMIPYFTSFVLITAVALIIRLVKVDELTHLLNDLWQGGTHLTFIYGVFWFITTFAISRIIFALTEATLPKYIRWPLYVAMYIGAHLLAHQLPGPGVSLNDPWWAPRYFLLGVPYLALGFVFKDKILHFATKTWKLLSTLVIYSTLVYLDLTHVFKYRFDWKYGIHDSLLLDLLIPCLGFYLILSLSRCIARTKAGKWLAVIGQQTTHIMYWHLIILAQLGI